MRSFDSLEIDYLSKELTPIQLRCNVTFGAVS